MNTDVCPPGAPDRTTLRPGRSLSTSGKVCSCLASISSPVMIEMLLATCDSGVGIRVAVTTISSATAAAPAAAAAQAAAAAVKPIIAAAVGNENDLLTASPNSRCAPCLCGPSDAP